MVAIQKLCGGGSAVVSRQQGGCVYLCFKNKILLENRVDTIRKRVLMTMIRYYIHYRWWLFVHERSVSFKLISYGFYVVCRALPFTIAINIKASLIDRIASKNARVYSKIANCSVNNTHVSSSITEYTKK